MSLRELAENLGDRLTDADRQLMDVLLANPRETAFLSGNEIAGRAAVHPATAVRFARKLGFDGYPALRARLQQEMFGVSEAAERMRQRMKRIERGAVLRSLVESEMRMLEKLPDQVSDADLAVAARAVSEASQTFLFAVGHASALSVLLEFRLGRLGYRTRSLKHVARDLAGDLLQARAGDAFILFCINSAYPLVGRILDYARELKANSIVISDMSTLPTRSKPDIFLTASRGPEGEPRSLAVPMALCNAMVLHVSRLDRKKTLRNLEALDGLRGRLERRPEERGSRS